MATRHKKQGHYRRIWNGNAYVEHNLACKATLQLQSGLSTDPKVGDHVIVNPRCFHPDCGSVLGEIINIKLEKRKVQVKYIYKDKTYSPWFDPQNAEIPMEWFEDYRSKIILHIIKQLAAFGYSATEITTAMELAENNLDINNIIEILHEQELKEHTTIEDALVEQSTITSVGTEPKTEEIVQNQQVVKDTKQFKIHVAVDFGNDGIAMAYVIDDETLFHDKWNSTKYDIDSKPKSIILLDENYDTLAFGKDAKFQYISMPMMMDKWMLFETFSPNSLQNTLTAYNGTNIECREIFVAVFKYLQEQSQKYLKRYNRKMRKLLKTLNKVDYQWIICVSSTLNEDTQNAIKQSTIDAGLVDACIENQCIIVNNFDCASVAMQYEIKKQEELKDTQLPKSDEFILIDVGGAMVSIVCHEQNVLGEWGSGYIDDQFIKLLENIFTHDWVNEFKTKNPVSYMQLLHNFQESKHTFYQQRQMKHNVTLPHDFVGFMQDKLDSLHGVESKDNNVKQMIGSCTIFGFSKAASLSGNIIQINFIVWSLLFDYVIEPIIENTKNVLFKHNSVKYLCLVGGLSASPYFQTRIKTEFGLKSDHSLQIIIPPKPILSVVHGATFFASSNKSTPHINVQVPSKDSVQEPTNDECISNPQIYEPHTNHENQVQRIDNDADSNGFVVDENPDKIIIIDNGSDTIKVGFGSSQTCHQFSSIFKTPKKYMERKYKEMYLGDEGDRYSSLLQGTNIIERGNVTDWDLMESLWRYTFDTKLVLNDVSEYNCVLTETLLRQPHDRYKCVQLMFEAFKINSLCLQNDAVLSLYGAGRVTGCAVGIGYGVTYSCGIYDGYVIPKSIIKVNSAGYDLTKYLKVLLSHKYANELMHIKHAVMRDIKHKYCYVKMNQSVETHRYKLPDSSVIEVNKESYECCEKLFGGFLNLSTDGFKVGNPDVFENNINFGIQDMLFETRKFVDTFDDIKDEFKYTVISGGSSLFKGLNKRLIYEMKKLNKNIKILENDETQYLSWIGASIMASNSEMRREFITYNDYNEQGPRIVDIKYP